MELQRECPECESEEFYQAASTMIHLGRKMKWRCAECGYTFVQIDDVVDTATA